MKTIEIHPLSVTVGAVAALVLLFACSSRSGASPSTPPAPVPVVTTQVTFYSDVGTFSSSNPWGNGSSIYSYSLGSTVAPTVITDIAWTDSSFRARLLVNGLPVYAWGFGGSAGSPTGFASPSWLSLAHGIRVPAGATMVIETVANYGSPAWSLAGYTL